MPTWGWLVTAFAGAFIVWMVPKIATFFAHALADALVDRIGDRLEPRWAADFDDALTEALAPIAHQVGQIKAEVTLNGGGSMKDLVLDTQRQVEYLITTAGGPR